MIALSMNGFSFEPFKLLEGWVAFSFYILPIGIVSGGIFFLIAWLFGFRATLVNCLTIGAFCGLAAAYLAFKTYIVPLSGGARQPQPFTLDRALTVLKFAAPFAVAGLFGGWAFWLYVIWRNPRYFS